MDETILACILRIAVVKDLQKAIGGCCCQALGDCAFCRLRDMLPEVSRDIECAKKRAWRRARRS